MLFMAFVAELYLQTSQTSHTVSARLLDLLNGLCLQLLKILLPAGNGRPFHGSRIARNEPEVLSR